jgi:pimeloyl-ACP methyl ester carboxylesterase
MKNTPHHNFRHLFIALIALICCFQTVSLTAQTAKDSVVFKTGYITANGVKLFYKEAGEGKPILFLHGTLATCDRHFAKQLNEFAKKNRVIAIHLRAHGKSSFPDSPFTIDSFTEDVFKFLEEMKVDNAIVVGFSLGGSIALNLAAKHPEKVSRLVTIGAFSSNEALRDEALKDLKSWGDNMVKMVKSNFGEGYDAEKIPVYIQKLKDAFLVEKEPKITEESLKKIKCPTLLVFGDLDFFSKIEHQLYLHKTIAKSNLCILPKTPHMVQTVKSDIFNKLLSEFIGE